MDLNEIYTNVLKERSKNKKYKGEIEGIKQDAINANCGDILQIITKIDEKKGKKIIDDISFIGEGCAISEVSSDMMCEILKGKSIDEAKKIVNQFINMITEDEENIKLNEYGLDERYENLGDLYSLRNIRYTPARVKCALLSWNTMKKLLDDLEE